MVEVTRPAHALRRRPRAHWRELVARDERGFSGGELTRRVQVRLRQWGSNRSPQPRRCGIAGGC